MPPAVRWCILAPPTDDGEAIMQGLMMDVPLTIPLIVRHAEALHGAKLVISRTAQRFCLC